MCERLVRFDGIGKERRGGGDGGISKGSAAVGEKKKGRFYARHDASVDASDDGSIGTLRMGMAVGAANAGERMVKREEEELGGERE